MTRQPTPGVYEHTPSDESGIGCGFGVTPNVDVSLLRERISRAIFDPGQTEGHKYNRTLTDWQTDAVMRVLGFHVSDKVE